MIDHRTFAWRRHGAVFAALMAGLLVTGTSRADTFHFSGNFQVDDDLALLVIDVPVTAPLTVLTLSFAQGGFVPLLTLFDSQGELAQTGGPAAGCCDQRLTLADAKGHYTLVLSQLGNYPGVRLADAFSNAGQAHFTAVYDPLQRPDATFIDQDSTQRSGFWAVDLSVAGTASAVPEPGAGWLLAAGLVGLAGLQLRPRRNTAG